MKKCRKIRCPCQSKPEKTECRVERTVFQNSDDAYGNSQIVAKPQNVTNEANLRRRRRTDMS